MRLVIALPLSFVLMLTFMSLWFINAATASDSNPLDQWRQMHQVEAMKRQQRADSIREFLDAAFSPTFWMQGGTDDYPSFFAAMIAHFNELTSEPKALSDAPLRELTIQAPWLKYLLFRDTKILPKDQSIVKWDGEITIGIDWPRYESPIVKSSSGIPQSRASENLTDAYPAIQQQIQALIPEIKTLTGLPARFIAPNDAEDTTEKFARIRIIPTKHLQVQLSGEDYFETPVTPDSKPVNFKNYEYLVLGQASFADSKSFLQGYLVPKENNALNMAVCKIEISHGEQATRAAVSDCLLRSLGLVGTFPAPEPNFNMQKESRFSDNERLLTKLLYCSEIKPGMDRNSVLSILATSNICFN